MNNAPAALLRDFSDRLSPMVVKELRHGLRTRAFVALLTSFQIFMIIVIGSGALGVPVHIISNIFWTITLLALLLALPLRGFASLSGEVQGGTMDMLTLTSISSFRIVYGKWTALVSQSLLLAISLLPYMVARYHFGGVEMVREAIALFVAVLASALATAAYVAFSSQRSLVLRLFLTAGILFSLLPVTVFVFSMFNSQSGDIIQDAFSSLPILQSWGIFAGVLLLSAHLIFTFLALGASRIAPVSENHSTWKRLIHLAMLILVTAVGWALSFHPDDDVVMWALFPGLFLTLLIGTDVLTEKTPRFPSVVQGLMHRGGLLWFMRCLLYPGWAAGVYFYILLGVLNISMFLWHWTRHTIHNFETVVMIVAIILISPLVPVMLRMNKTNLFANWWVVHLSLGVSGILLVMLRDISGSSEAGYLGVLTPVTGLMGAMESHPYEDAILATTLGFSLCWLAVACIRAVAEGRQYRVLEAEARELSKPSPDPAA
jgi:ABC-type transport system involved in cytochrome c biogenesis permease component